MKNSDPVTYVGYSAGGKGVYGDFGVKVRFAIDRIRRSKELTKLGAASVYFLATPKPMTKANALAWFKTQNDPAFANPDVKAAVERATQRLLPSTPKMQATK